MMSDRLNENSLVRDLFAEVVTDEVRQESLRSLLRYSKQRQRRRRVLGSLGGTAVLVGFLCLLFVRTERPSQQLVTNPAVASALTSQLVKGTPIRVLTDEELFAMFPEQPIGFIEDQMGYRVVFLDSLDDVRPASAEAKASGD